MSASVRLAAAFAVAAPLLLSTVLSLPASAADLGSPYDDPRYGDAYGQPYDRDYGNLPPDFEPAGPPPARDRYLDRDADDFGGPPRRWSRFDEGRFGRDCVPRRVIHARLRDDGWYDFRNLDIRGSVAVVTARSPSGRRFDLTVNRCSGDIVDAHPLQGRRDRDYAYGGRRSWQHY